MWLNSKDSSIDEKSYDDNFDPGSMVSKYKVPESVNEQDPAHSLRRYAQRSSSSENEDLQYDQEEELEEKEEDTLRTDAPEVDIPEVDADKNPDDKNN